MDSDLKRFEEELERLSPGHLPEGLIARMEAAMEGWEAEAETVDGESGQAGQAGQARQKVVPFPQSIVETSRERRGGANLWAAAAGVALLGALAGLVLTGDPERNNESTAASRPPVENIRPAEFAPQAAKRKILRASEERVVIANGEQPVRVLRLDYVDRVVFRNAAGEEVHVEVPAVNFRLIPAVTD